MSSGANKVRQHTALEGVPGEGGSLSSRPAAPLPPSRRARDRRTGVPEEQYTETQAELETSQLMMDRLTHAWLGRLTGGISPASLLQAYSDWGLHLVTSPGKQGQLVEKALRKAMRLGAYLPHAVSGMECRPCIEPLPQDNRFEGDDWQAWPFNIIHQSFLLTQQWWHNATTNVEGVSEHNSKVVNFTTRQFLDMFSPSNMVYTNPEVMRRTYEQGGLNFVQGYINWLEDIKRLAYKERPAGTEEYTPGQSVAVTPGKVIYRNHLIELIQYQPTTEKVRAEPLLFVPAWIMKYYILDLSPHNSLVHWLLDQGYTVFMISWKNPCSEDWNLGLDDYRLSGIMKALEVINAIVPDQKIHATGYCLGGTLLSIAAAVMSRDGDDRLASMTLFASLTDFTKTGELELFIDESQIDFLEDLMWEEGYFDAWYMKSTFEFLRSNDLVWSRMIHDYLMGERSPMFDLKAWSTDATRLPYRMHSEYLRKLYLSDELAEGNYKADGAVVTLGDISVPIFAVGTRTDHIAPWQSVYKIHALTDTRVTFVLTSGGHNAGVVSEPGHKGRVYQIADKSPDAPYVGYETWYSEVPEREGSWWPEWEAWLREHSSGEIEPPAMGAPDKGLEPLADAPGEYVLQR